MRSAKATLRLIDRMRWIANDIRRTKIKVIDNSQQVQKLIAAFRKVNGELKDVREDLKDLAKTLETVGKLLGVLEKILKKVATSGIA